MLDKQIKGATLLELWEFWTFSPAVDGAAFYIEPSFSLCGSVSSSISFRPSINLKSEIQITEGDGTGLNPYIVG